MNLIHRERPAKHWWEDAVIYQIYPKSFASSSGKTGDLKGITSRLTHLAKLGVDAIWLSPFYASPQKDGGYDVADYRKVDPLFGTNTDADALIRRAHELGLRVIVDLVPNHTSDQHKWFQDALTGGKNAPERANYWFRDGKGKNGELPPNDWTSIFGGPAWTRVCDRADAPCSPWENDQQYYLHLFDTSQPDLNWENPRVQEEFCDILRFWLDAGVDGFRVDVAHGLSKDSSLPDWQFHWEMVNGGSKLAQDVPQPPMWNRPQVHEIYRQWRKVLDEYGADKMLVAEAWLENHQEMAKYVRPGEMNQSFNFFFLCAPFTAQAYREVIQQSLQAMDEVDAPCTWVLSNHDVVRAASRFGLSYTGKNGNGIFAEDEQPDAQLGKKRALAAHLLQSTLPGSCYIYQGEELSLPEHTTLANEYREDPAFFRTNGREAGRDGQRVPLPWEADQPAFGFSPDGISWLPQPAEWAAIAVDKQEADPCSSLHFFQKMYALRKELRLGQATLIDARAGICADREPEDHSPQCAADYLHYISQAEGRADLHLVVAFEQEVQLPATAQIIFSSELERNSENDLSEADLPRAQILPANSAVWYFLAK